ncbi:hypothetical protein [Spirosoma koreense]
MNQSIRTHYADATLPAFCSVSPLPTHRQTPLRSKTRRNRLDSTLIVNQLLSDSSPAVIDYRIG